MTPTKELIKVAQEFAQKAHAAQMYDQFPYFKHLEQVEEIVKWHDATNYILRTAAFLHDVLEDTATSYSDLKKVFGEEIAEIVYCMTDELGRNRKEKKEKTYPKIRSNPDSVILKVCDRIANLEFSINKEGIESSFIEMYRKEYKQFKWNLYVPGHCDRLWERLDNLIVYGTIDK